MSNSIFKIVQINMKHLLYTGLSCKVLENLICLEKYLKITQRPSKDLEFYYLL